MKLRKAFWSVILERISCTADESSAYCGHLTSSLPPHCPLLCFYPQVVLLLLDLITLVCKEMSLRQTKACAEALGSAASMGLVLSTVLIPWHNWACLWAPVSLQWTKDPHLIFSTIAYIVLSTFFYFGYLSKIIFYDYMSTLLVI